MPSNEDIQLDRRVAEEALEHGVSLLISGFLYVEGNAGLGRALEIIQMKCDDWAENMEPKAPKEPKA